MNRITVKPRNTPGGVRERIRETLQRDAEFDANHIQVQIEGGKATLRGMVRAYAEKRDAERAARNAPGVTEVDNQFVIDPYAGELHFEPPAGVFRGLGEPSQRAMVSWAGRGQHGPDRVMVARASDLPDPPALDGMVPGRPRGEDVFPGEYRERRSHPRRLPREAPARRAPVTPAPAPRRRWRSAADPGACRDAGAGPSSSARSAGGRGRRGRSTSPFAGWMLGGQQA